MICDSRDLNVMCEEIKEKSNEIAVMKRERNRMSEGPEKQALTKSIKEKVLKAKEYIKEMERVSAKKGQINYDI